MTEVPDPDQRTCIPCGQPASQDDLTCAACGEASWGIPASTEPPGGEEPPEGAKKRARK